MYEDDYDKWVQDWKLREYLRMSISSLRNLVAILPIEDGAPLSKYERWSLELGYAPFFTRCAIGYRELERNGRLTRRRSSATLPV